MRDSKLRPGLLVADVSYSRQLDWVICLVTTQLLPGSRQIALSVYDLKVGSLNEQSWVRPDRLMTMNRSLFGNTIARLTDKKTGEILAAVQSIF